MKQKQHTLRDFWNVTAVSEDGILTSANYKGFMFEADGLDGSFLSEHQLNSLHQDWRSVLRFSPNEEVQFIFRKRVEFNDWVQEQLQQSFLGDNAYGRRILLDRLADQLSEMSQEEPRLLSQKIIICFWTGEAMDDNGLIDKRMMVKSQLSSFGFPIKALDKTKIQSEINLSTQDLAATPLQEPQWPALKIEAGLVHINDDLFRAAELAKLPESFTELGMIQAITSLPYPLDLCVRLKARDERPIVSRLERKRNLLNAQKNHKNSPSPQVESQIEQIDQVLRSLADRSENIYDMKVVVGLRFPKQLESFQRKALATILRSGAKMDFCEFDETTLTTFDSYLECIPGFSGENIRSHTIMGSNAVHFLPLFRPAKGDRRAIITFQTRNASLYGLDPVDTRLANYNWMVSGTSGAGKSFFVNSLLAQSITLNPNIFIVDIGGSYNKLTRFLGGKVVSLGTDHGFEMSPFFLPKSADPSEERMRRQHIYQIFLEITRVDGKLPGIEIRHLLSECLEQVFNMDILPEKPISYLIQKLSEIKTGEAQKLKMLLYPWGNGSFCSQFLDNSKFTATSDRILTFDLKDLTQFEDLSRVVQLIVCASLWARIRATRGERFSWIVLDEVAFSLLKTQPQFVDELVSTLRKYYGGAVIVVQDLEKITSNFAGSSILQNTQSKAILQQRGDPAHYADALSLTQIDQWAIESLRREKGVYSDVFLIRDYDKTVIRHVPSSLEYWLATTAPEDNQKFTHWMEKNKGSFQKKAVDLSLVKGGMGS